MVETAATQTKPAYAGFKTLDCLRVRAGGLRFCSRDFQSPPRLLGMGLSVEQVAEALGLSVEEVEAIAQE